jgi:gliding motility-associated-like protein
MISVIARKFINSFLLSFCGTLLIIGAFAQAPSIRYATPQVYKVGIPITPIKPEMLPGGGNLPAGEYGTVTTFAGNGQYSYTDGAANAASFRIPTGLAIDNDNNIYVADFGNDVIRKITPQGLVSTFAGNGSGGRDNGTGTQASFYRPSGLALDPSGVIYVVEQVGEDVRKITATAQVSLLAGSGFIGKADGTGTAASFNTPVDVAIGPDRNLYVSDMQNHLIRKITADGKVSTFAGNGIAASTNGTLLQASFGGPQGIAFDSNGNLFIADSYSYTVRKVSTEGMVTTFAGNGNRASIDGIGTSAGFTEPTYLAFDTNDDLYVADANMVRKITREGVVTTVAGNNSSFGYLDGVGTAARFSTVGGLGFDRNGFLFVGEISNHIIRKITLSGYTIDKSLPQGLTFNPEDGTISGTPVSLAVAENYTITARNKSGKGSTAVRIEVTGNSVPATEAPKINYASPKVYTINAPIQPLIPDKKGGAVDPNGFSIDKPLPAGLSLDPNTGVISGTPMELSPATIYTIIAKNSAGPSQAQLNIKISDEILSISSPPDIKYASPQTLYLKAPLSRNIVPEQRGGPVQAHSAGLVTNFAGTGQPGRDDGPKAGAKFDGPAKVAIDGQGNFYISDFNNYSLRKITPAGEVSTPSGAAGPGYANGVFRTAQLQGPRGLVTDKAGNVYIADVYSIRKVNAIGITSTLAGNGTAGNTDGTGTAARFDGVVSLAIDNTDNIYAIDQGNGTIRKITPGGVVTTIAGNRNRNNVDGQGTAASFNNPQDIVLYNGNFYIADYLYIRKMTPGGLVTTIAGNGIPKVLNGNASSAGFGNASALGVNGAGEFYVLDLGNNTANEGSAILRLIDKDNNVSTVNIMDNTGTKTYLSVPNGLTLDKSGLIYVASGSNYLQTLSFDRYTIDKALPAGLTFDTTTGEISGTPTVLSPAQDYTIIAYNSGGSSPTTLNLKVVPSETKLPSIITFPEFAANPVWDADFNIDPKITRSQTETPLVLTSSNPEVATINADNTLHILSAGEAVITASQAGNDNYLPADAVARTITVSRANTITSFAAIDEKTACDADFSVAGTSTNTVMPIIYSSSNPNVATVNQQGMVHIVAAGNTDIKATQAQSALYNALPEVVRPLTVTATNSQIPAPTVSISTPSTNVYESQNVTFIAITNGAADNYQWQVNGVNAGHNSATFSTSALQDQDRVSCVVNFTNHCIAPVTSNEIKLTVSPPPVSIVPPNTFSPNGDGVNDTWKIPALLSYPKCSVRIFNRNGTQIILSLGYSKAWDGTYAGKNLPAGVYYYVISTGDIQADVSGNVTILR